MTGLHMTADHWYTFGEQGPYPSVTKVLGILDKPALVPWAKRTVAEYAVAQHASGELATLIADKGHVEAAKHLAALPDYQRDAAATVGSGVHLLADMATRGAESDAVTPLVPKEYLPYLAAFRDFLTAHSGSQVVSSEKAVISFGDQYAGTYDLLMQIEGQLWLIDIKTSKGIYAETGLQLVAYGYAEHIVLPNDPTLYPMPHVDRYAVLHLRPDKIAAPGWRLVEYGVGERDYVAFLAARELFAWKQEGRFKGL